MMPLTPLSASSSNMRRADAGKVDLLDTKQSSGGSTKISPTGHDVATNDSTNANEVVTSSAENDQADQSTDAGAGGPFEKFENPTECTSCHMEGEKGTKCCNSGCCGKLLDERERRDIERQQGFYNETSGGDGNGDSVAGGDGHDEVAAPGDKAPRTKSFAPHERTYSAFMLNEWLKALLGAATVENGNKVIVGPCYITALIKWGSSVVFLEPTRSTTKIRLTPSSLKVHMSKCLFCKLNDGVFDEFYKEAEKRTPGFSTTEVPIELDNGIIYMVTIPEVDFAEVDFSSVVLDKTPWLLALVEFVVDKEVRTRCDKGLCRVSVGLSLLVTIIAKHLPEVQCRIAKDMVINKGGRKIIKLYDAVVVQLNSAASGSGGDDGAAGWLRTVHSGVQRLLGVAAPPPPPPSLAPLEAALKDVAAAVDEQSADMSDMQTQQTVMQAQQTVMQTELATQKATQKAAMETIRRNQQEALELLRNAAPQDVKAIAQQVASLLDRRKGANGWLAVRNADPTLQSEVDMLSAENGRLRGETKSLEQRMGAVEVDVSTLKGDVGEMRAHSQQQQAQLKQQQAQFEELRAHSQQQQAQLEELQAQQQQQQAQLEEQGAAANEARHVAYAARDGAEYAIQQNGDVRKEVECAARPTPMRPSPMAAPACEATPEWLRTAAAQVGLGASAKPTPTRRSPMAARAAKSTPTWLKDAAATCFGAASDVEEPPPPPAPAPFEASCVAPSPSCEAPDGAATVGASPSRVSGASPPPAPPKPPPLTPAPPPPPPRPPATAPVRRTGSLAPTAPAPFSQATLQRQIASLAATPARAATAAPIDGMAAGLQAAPVLHAVLSQRRSAVAPSSSASGASSAEWEGGEDATMRSLFNDMEGAR